MILIDVNVLVYAHREDAPRHDEYLEWLEAALNSQDAVGYNDHVFSGFLRVVTHPRVFITPTPLEEALVFAEQIRNLPQTVAVTPGSRHWQIFVDLCRQSHARGNLIPDAYFAALAIESGSEWITTDGDFSRFPGLRWKHPLAS